MPFPLKLNIGTSDSPDFINVSSIRRVKFISGTGGWHVIDKLIPSDDAEWITITAEQYDQLVGMLEEKEEEKEELRETTPSFRITLDPEPRG